MTMVQWWCTGVMLHQRPRWPIPPLPRRDNVEPLPRSATNQPAETAKPPLYAGEPASSNFDRAC